MKSAQIVSAPMQSPPKVAAIGIYLLSTFNKLSSLYPLRNFFCSISYFFTSLGEIPAISIQVFEKRAHVVRTNVT